MGDPVDLIKAEQYIPLGRVTNFRYSHTLGNIIRFVVNLRDFKHIGHGSSYTSNWNTRDSEDVVVFLENIDSERTGEGWALNYKTRKASLLALSTIGSNNNSLNIIWDLLYGWV